MWKALWLACLLGSAETPTISVDVVRALRGEAAEGRPELALEHAGFRYLFAGPETLAAFRAEPERFEVRLGGACARMGPLSSTCSTEIWAVHADGFYLFASEACRAGFLKDPAALLESDDPRPEGDVEQQARGHALIERAVAAVGGAARLDALSTYRERHAATVAIDGRDYARSIEQRLLFEGQRVAALRVDSGWDEQVWGRVLRADEAFFVDSAGARDMHPEQRRAAERERDVHPLAILRARARPDFVALSSAPDTVRVWFAGRAASLRLDPDTGRLASLSFRGRGPSSRLGTVERRFTDWREVGGLALPSAYEESFDGVRAADGDRRWSVLEVDLELGPAFAR